jgi:hypothetical protein
MKISIQTETVLVTFLVRAPYSLISFRPRTGRPGMPFIDKDFSWEYRDPDTGSGWS